MKDEKMEHASNVRRKSVLKIALSIFVLTSLGRMADVVIDLVEGSTLWHVGVESFLAFLGAMGAIVLVQELYREKKLRVSSEYALEEASEYAKKWRDDAGKWRSEYEEMLRGLGAAIDDQFVAWNLTPAESEVCLLLLKGLSFKEVGDVRNSSERTVRQQANAAYKKAGLGGRAELSAFFLEDLLLPSPKEASGR